MPNQAIDGRPGNCVGASKALSDDELEAARRQYGLRDKGQFDEVRDAFNEPHGSNTARMHGR